MAPKRSNRSTEYTLGLLNNINALGRDAAKIQDSKRRRTTHADVFEIPISPSPTQSRKTPQTEPKNKSQLNLRNHTVPRFARPTPPPNVFDTEEENGPSKDESGPGDSESESMQDGPGGSGEEELDDSRDELRRQTEHDPFPEPVDLFPAEDEGQVDDQIGYEARNAQEDVSGDGIEYEDEEEVDDQAGEEAIDARVNVSEDESEYEAQVEEGANDSPGSKQNHSTPTQQIANADTLEVQILQRVPRNQMVDTHKSCVSANAQEPREAPDTPKIQLSRPNQEHRCIRSSLFTWLTETTKDSGFKDTWEAIRRARKSLKAHADPSTKKNFRGIMKLIERLRGLFETTVKDPASASSLKNQCNLIATSIFKENQWIIYTEAPEDEDDGAHLVNQLEAHVIPRLIDLVILGFKTYKTITDQGARHFRIVLDLLWGSCDRISCLAQMHYEISGGVMARSKIAMRHVKTLKDALNDGRLRETAHRIPQRPLAYRQFELEEVESHISCGRWTSPEKTALRDGLQLYRGEDRYIDIKCDNTIGGQLSKRILQNIRGQAVKLGLDDP
ncbi:hypothetical protein Pdw03_3496 [Penicillium digitatum]|uniref:Uncharacterized protein n=3 Tax=Penicillium digitatum TaxID=36651 RepID=K9FZ70_PEND2|nr:hypothetical protein PDIP_79700 [Penicillium digitatum Pd1]EKV06345.1 hypothetical protein PDIP_79700 [Penicillium digitatum Pd1]EKV07963.1 hypothetical protein PDIG_70390 [Penicillium digitatum PHI26]QQK40642.1 hypothetical protein Pdw03_3496 [Penicillium digitatum]